MNIKARLFLLIAFIFICSVSNGQVCDVVINVCSNELISSNPADEDNFPDLQASCVTIDGVRSIWYKIKIESGSELTFDINPTNPGVDYDFVVYGPNPNCENVTDDIAIRANYSGNLGATGLSASSSNECIPAVGSTYSSSINVRPGEEYLVVVDRYSDNPSTFDLIWGDGVVLDCSIVVGDLGPDQDVCEGTTVTLDATPTDGVAVGYHWFLDDGSGFVELEDEEDNPILTIDNDVSGIYRVEVIDEDENLGDDEVRITFHPQPIITDLPFENYEQCDTDGIEDGFFTFNLKTLFDSDLLNGQDTSIFEVVYYNSQNDAENNTNPIINPENYTNAIALTPDEIFARTVNIAAPEVCDPAITSFNLVVLPKPSLQIVQNYEVCDDDSDGDDTNGIVQNFILSSMDVLVLGIQDPADFTVAYFENQNDADNDSAPIDKINPYTNTTDFSQPIFVRLTNNVTQCFSVSAGPLFELVVNPKPVITNNVLLEVCDDDQDGFASFDLTTANPLISLNFANETFQYYPSELDAENNTNEIADPTNYTNGVDTNDVVWVKTSNANDCFRISQVNLEITSTEIPVTFQKSFEQCDDYLDTDGSDTANNDETDGIATFDFSSVTNEIVSLFPVSQTINVSYYESLVDANNLANPILNTSTYRNINSPFTQQIFIRVDNPANVNCAYVGTHITLTVNPVPFANNVEDIEVCDDANDGNDTNGFVQSIDLESQTPIILGTQDPANFTVTYHEDLIDATNGTAPLSSPYANTTADQQTIFVRVTNNTTGCFVDRLSFEVVIHPLPVITDVVELKQCDDDNDGYSFFNLNEAATDISTNFANETFVFYPTLADAENDTNAFSDAQAIAFENRTETIDTVWARAISEFGCYRIAQVTIIVSTTGLPATFQRSFSECDDFLDIDGNDTVNNDDNDGISAFDFSSVTQEVLDLFPTTQQLTVTYYRNQADALAELNAIADPSNYRNIGYPVTQQIYIRVDSDLDNDCLGFGPFITLTVEPVTAQEVGDLELCDNLDDGDGFNGIVQTFNLEAQTPTILGTQDPANFTVSYHTSADDALSGANPIVSTTNYENTTPNLQTIYVRVTNNNSGCFTAQTSFDLIVNPLPVANFVEDLEICDDNSDGSAQNGFSQSFDLELQTATILGTQDPLQFGVSYHASLADAQAGVFPLGSPFSNSEPFSQTIYVRVYNDATGCANGISNFDVIVNPEPTTENDASNLSYCDDDTDGDDTNGFVQNIDLDGHIPEILGPLQDEDDFTVTFHETQADATAGTAPLTTPYANTARDRQTIFVRVVNDRTQCVNDDFNFDVIVNPLPDFKVTSPQIVCLSGPDLTIGVENPLTVYDYVWETPDGTNIIAEEITISSGGLYLVTATTTDGTGCSRTREIQVNESIVATITDDDVTIVDDSENNSITIDPTNLGIGDYHYALINENGIQTPFQDDPVFENLEGGFYTIVVQDKNGCRPDAELLVSVIEFPKFFTPNNDGVKDTWAIKGVNSVFFPNAQVYIFNRFGKVVAQIDVDSPGWTGTYNGKVLPSDDYWFSVTLVDRNGVVRNRKGNFSLLRR